MKNVLKFFGSVLASGVIFISNVDAMEHDICDEPFLGRVLILSAPEGVECEILLDEDCSVKVDIDRENFSKDKIYMALVTAISDEAANYPALECLLTSEWLDNKTDLIYTALENT